MLWGEIHKGGLGTVLMVLNVVEEDTKTYKLLDKINDASDVRALTRGDLPQLCDEVRAALLILLVRQQAT